MPPTSKIAPRVAEYLTAHGPDTTTRIARALHIARPSVDAALRDNAAFCHVGYAGKRLGRHASPLWGVLAPGETPPHIELPRPLYEQVFAYLDEHGRAPVQTIADALGFTTKTVRQTLRVYSDLFFVVDVRSGANGTGTTPTQFWDVEAPPVMQLDAEIVEWTHTTPTGRALTLRGRVVDRDADGVHVWAHGVHWVWPVNEVYEVAA